MKLQTARQNKTEGPQEFADRRRALAPKIFCKINDPLAQLVHQENAERMLLATYVAGLTGTPGRQVRYANPQTVQQALQIALSVQEAEKQERFNSSFYPRFENSVNLHSRSPSRSGSDNEMSSHSGAKRTPSNSKGQHSSGYRKDIGHRDRQARTKAALRCYECQGTGHFSRECPTRLRREEDDSYAPRRWGRTECSKRPGPPDRAPFSDET
jgi:hypothetical protein